jgi:hypothetical protein
LAREELDIEGKMLKEVQGGRITQTTPSPSMQEIVGRSQHPSAKADRADRGEVAQKNS